MCNILKQLCCWFTSANYVHYEETLSRVRSVLLWGSALLFTCLGSSIRRRLYIRKNVTLRAGLIESVGNVLQLFTHLDVIGVVAPVFAKQRWSVRIDQIIQLFVVHALDVEQSIGEFVDELGIAPFSGLFQFQLLSRENAR